MRERYGPLYQWYTDDYAEWEAVVFLRKAAYVLCLSLITDPVVQSALCLAVSVAYFVAVARCRPLILNPGRMLGMLFVADMFNTARFFHARHETGAALAAGAVAFQAPLAAWLLRRR